MKSRSTFYSTGIPTTFNDLGECDEIDRGGVPCAVPFCGYGTADFGIIPDRMKEDGNQIVVYQPEGELEKESNLHFLQIPNSDRPVAIYSLDVIISVGYRVKSMVGTRFRQWANKVLKENPVGSQNSERGCRSSC